MELESSLRYHSNLHFIKIIAVNIKKNEDFNQRLLIKTPICQQSERFHLFGTFFYVI